MQNHALFNERNHNARSASVSAVHIKALSFLSTLFLYLPHSRRFKAVPGARWR